MNRRTLLLGSGSAIALGAVWLALRPSGTEGLLPGAALAQETPAEIDTSTIPDMVLGNPDATVEVIEYGSFTCPHCKEFHADQFQQIKANYIDTGKIRFVYRELVRNRPDLWASMLARCNGELRFFGISDLLFERQADWTAGGDPAQIAQNLRQIGKVAGMDDATVEACMTDIASAQTILAWSEENSTRDGVDSTPTFIINGEKHLNMSYADFAKLLDEKLAG
jgi:protein-disulfide isomerase